MAADDYRAPCRAERAPSGCRNCGASLEGHGPRGAYCTRECRQEFEVDHFWDTARPAALERASIYRIRSFEELIRHRDGTVEPRLHAYRLAYICARCGAEIHMPEVNHIVPVNGRRTWFSCSHHLDNLEVLCHGCHLATTADQRLRGLIGRPKAGYTPPML